MSTWRLPAGEIESLVLDNVRDQLIDQILLIDQPKIGRLESGQLEDILRAAAELADALTSAWRSQARGL